MTVFQFCIKKLLILHDLMARGRSDCSTAELLRENLADLSHCLSEEERFTLDGLCGDLYMLCGEGMYIKTTEEEKLDLKQKMSEALERQSRCREVSQKFRDFALKD